MIYPCCQPGLITSAFPSDGLLRFEILHFFFFTFLSLSISLLSNVSLGFHFERRTGYVIVAPLDQYDVFAALPDDITHVVVVLFHVLDKYLLARSFRSVNTHEQYIVACKRNIQVFYISTTRTTRTGATQEHF